MKLRFLLFLLLGCGLGIQAQELKVFEFRPEMSMVDAVRFPKNDLNGERCGLIRLGLVMPDAVFEGDIISSEYKEGEWWIYMPKGSNWLTIKSMTHVPLRYEFEPIQSNVTYLMTVVEITGAGGKPKPTHQYLAFQITPTNAILEVNGQLWEVGSDGSAMKFVSFGTYNYRVQAPNYHAETGIVIVNDPENTQIKKINLKSDFVEVTLKVDADAEIWVNNEMKGICTWTGQLGKGVYKIECKQANHETSLTTKEITASMQKQTITLPVPQPIYGSINIESTPNFAKVFIDGKEIGETPRFIPELLIGEHEVRLTKQGYSDYIETIVVNKEHSSTINAVLSSGQDVTFSCNVRNAQLRIDGDFVGNANGTYHIKDGYHSISASASGYQNYYDNITIPISSRKYKISMKKDKKDNTKITNPRPTKTSNRNLWQPLKYTDINGQISLNSVGSGAVLGVDFGKIEKSKLFGLYGDFRFQVLSDDLSSSNNIIWNFAGGGGASMRLNNGIENYMFLLDVGADVGWTFDDSGYYNALGLCGILFSKIKFVHKEGLGLFVEGFVGRFGSLTCYGANIGIGLVLIE